MNIKSIGIFLITAPTSISTVVLAGQASATPAAQVSVATILSRTTLDVWGDLHSIVATGRDEQAEIVFQHVVPPPGANGGWHTHAGAVFVTVAERMLSYYDEHNPVKAGPSPKVKALSRKPTGKSFTSPATRGRRTSCFT